MLGNFVHDRDLGCVFAAETDFLLARDESLDGEDVLPGLSIPLAALFPEKPSS